MKKYLLLASLLILSACNSSSPVSTSTGSTPPPETRPSISIPSPTSGTGKNTITIFADFQCPACQVFHSRVTPIFEDYAKRGYLTIVYKQYPLTQIHPNAERDALAALCSAEQGKYKEYKDALYALESTREVKRGTPTVSDEDRVTIGKDITDQSKLRECIEANRYLSQIDSEIKEGNTLGVQGTPTVFLDGKRLDPAVYRDESVLRTILDRILGAPQSGSGMTK